MSHQQVATVTKLSPAVAQVTLKPHLIKMRPNTNIIFLPVSGATYDIELMNRGSSWICYRFKCSKPDLFIVKPCISGLLPPGDCQPFEIIFQPQNNAVLLLEEVMIVEVAMVKPLSHGVTRKNLDASTVWNETSRNEISQQMIKYDLGTVVMNAMAWIY